MFFISIIFALVAAFFYHMILNELGIRVNFLVILAALIATSAVSLLFSQDGPAFMCFVYIIGVMVLGISLFLRESTGNMVEIFKKADAKNREMRYKSYKIGNREEAQNFNINDIRTPKFWDYSGIIFHMLSVLILITGMFGLLPSNYSERVTGYLFSSAEFHVKTSIMLALIGIVNPFRDLPEKSQNKISELQNKNPGSSAIKLLAKVTEPQTFRIIKSFLTAAIVGYFLQGSFFTLPWKSGILVVTIYTLMVLIFVISNLYQMLFYPQEFAVNTKLRVSVLLSSFHGVIFVSAILAFSLMFFGSVFSWNLDLVSSEGLLLTGFNVVMAFVSYKIVRR